MGREFCPQCPPCPARSIRFSSFLGHVSASCSLPPSHPRHCPLPLTELPAGSQHQRQQRQPRPPHALVLAQLALVLGVPGREGEQPVQLPNRSAEQISGIGFPRGPQTCRDRPPPPAPPRPRPGPVGLLPPSPPLLHSCAASPRPSRTLVTPLLGWGPCPPLKLPPRGLSAFSPASPASSLGKHPATWEGAAGLGALLHPDSRLCQAPLLPGVPTPASGQIPGLAALGSSPPRCPRPQHPASLRRSRGHSDGEIAAWTSSQNELGGLRGQRLNRARSTGRSCIGAGTEGPWGSLSRCPVEAP